MARTAPANSDASRPAPARPASALRGSRNETVPDERDLAQAKEDALLQLKIGRTAGYYTVMVFAALFADGLLIAVFNPFAAGLPIIGSLYFLLFPLGSALLLSGFGLYVKWDTYQIWPWEPHFWATVLSVPFAAALTYLFAARIIGFGPTGNWTLLPWILPVVLASVALPLIGLAMTWQEWSYRKTGAVLAALVPIPIALLLYFPGSATQATSLTLTLVSSGGLFLCAGSLLHLISTGTQAHEREVIVSGQSRLFQFSEDLRHREDALRFRESTLVRREADVEVAEAASARKLLAVEDVQNQLRQLEQDLEQRATKIHSDFQQTVAKLAEVAQLQRELSDRQGQLEMREQAVGEWEAGRQAREQKLSEAEGELVRRQMELAELEKEVLARQQTLPAQEARLEARRLEIERKASELAAKGTSGATEGNGPTVPAGSSLEEREARVASIQRTINDQSALLGRKARDLDARAGELRKNLEEQARREQALVAREHSLSLRESDAQTRADAASQRQRQYEEALARVEVRARDLERRQAELASRLDDSLQRSTTLQAREATLRQHQEDLIAGRAELERAQRTLIARQKDLEARDSELALRLHAAQTPPAAASGASRGAAGTLPSVPAPRPAAGRAGRTPSGVSRLDELLLGGLPEHSHVALVGPAFVGKELLLYSFLAEGLKAGGSIVVVTTSRSPGELSQEIGMVSPQFREYEHMGRVNWIDASNPSSSPSLEEVGGAFRAVVKGPADFTGILSALATIVKGPPGPGRPLSFRVGVLSLSACIAQGDPKATYGFVSNFISILKPRPVEALYALDAGTVDDSQVESAVGRVDGAIRFREERGKTFLSIQGLGEVATRDWIEYRASNRSLSLGSFSLERIR